VKRGLVEAADANRGVYEGRLERLRERLRSEGLRVALIYGDTYRSDDIAHLTNLCIYWNEGVVAVPADGPPVFLAKLSKRVHPWMRRTSVIEDLRASQKLPELIGSYLDELEPGGVGMVDLAWWPAQLVDGITGAATDRAFTDLPDAVRSARLVPDELDRADLAHAGGGCAAGIAAASDASGNTSQRLAALELAARGLGARDVVAFCRKLGAGVQIECAVQFANVWAYGARPAGDGDAAREAFSSVAQAITAGATASDIQAAAGPSATVRVVSHCDLATGGELRGGDSGPLLAGEAVAVAVRVGDAMMADTFLIDAEGATAITRAEVSA
jgi:hypothetical protein